MGFTVFLLSPNNITRNDEVSSVLHTFFYLPQNVNRFYLFQEMSAEKYLKLR